MGSVGLLLIYHIFDIIRERIAHMDDGEKDWVDDRELGGSGGLFYSMQASTI